MRTANCWIKVIIITRFQPKNWFSCSARFVNSLCTKDSKCCAYRRGHFNDTMSTEQKIIEKMWVLTVRLHFWWFSNLFPCQLLYISYQIFFIKCYSQHKNWINKKSSHHIGCVLVRHWFSFCVVDVNGKKLQQTLYMSIENDVCSLRYENRYQAIWLGEMKSNNDES